MTGYDVVESDVLVIGGGGAGTRAALAAGSEGVTVSLVLKGQVAHSGVTPLAGSGYQVVLGVERNGDNPQVAFEDTVREGRFLGDENLVRVLANEAREYVPTLQSHGLKLAREASGELRRVQQPGQSFPRNVFMMGSGYAMMVALRRELRQHDEIKAYEDHYATALLAHEGRVCGAVTLDHRRGGITVFQANAVVLATGGYEQLLEFTDTEPGSTGDGAMLAFHAGAHLVDLEMLLFYPTCLVWPQEIAAATIGYETLLNPQRVDGTLRNALGDQMVPNAQYPDVPPPRDVLTRLMFREAEEGRATPRGGLLIDLATIARSPEKASAIRSLDSVFFTTLRNLGLDVTTMPIEVRPALHHCLGGVRINERCETGVAGLYAGGEVAGNLHGANRIAGNAIAETQVFGARAGRYAAQFARQVKRLPVDAEQVESQVRRLSSFGDSHPRPIRPGAVKAKVKSVMQRHMASQRDHQGMTSALKAIEHLRQDELPRVRVTIASPFNYELQEAVEVAAMVDLAEATILAAMERKESRGHHFRADYPEPRDEWRQHTIATKDAGGVTISTAPVVRQA